jgi:hypothetical protein
VPFADVWSAGSGTDFCCPWKLTGLDEMRAWDWLQQPPANDSSSRRFSWTRTKMEAPLETGNAQKSQAISTRNCAMANATLQECRVQMLECLTGVGQAKMTC